MSEKTLPKKTLFFYGLSEMPLSIASLPLLAFIPNYYVSQEELMKKTREWVSNVLDQAICKSIIISNRRF